VRPVPNQCYYSHDISDIEASYISIPFESGWIIGYTSVTLNHATSDPQWTGSYVSQPKCPPPRAKKHKDEDDLYKQLQSYAETLAKIQEDYLHLEKRLKTITEELERMRAGHVERFGVGRFQSSDEDIRFYTSLPSYSIFIFIYLYQYLEPLLKYLHYRLSKYTEVTRQLLSRQRLIQLLDDFFSNITFMS
jgi:hypothetical protein